MSIAAHQEAEDAVFLKPHIKIEPLACGWYVWPHLVAPVQLAMNIKFRYLPLMKSFLSNPSVHATAARDPTLFGGPFVTLSETDVPNVRKLMEDTIERCSELITLAEDLRELDVALQDGASGFSLNEFYHKLPQSLRGLIEFTYDLNNHPAIRLFEELLYEDAISAHTQQIHLSPVCERDRCFFMYTPRLQTPESMTFDMRFADERLDTLASRRAHCGSFRNLARQFEVPQDKLATFRAFFTTTPPNRPSSRHYAGDGVRVRYFGHACVLAQTARTSVLFDPMIATEKLDDGRLTIDDLPDFIDYVVITHDHQDHCCPEMLVQLRHRIGRVIIPRNNSGSLGDPSMKMILKALGFENIDVVDAFDSIPIPEGEITSLPFTGEHCDLNIHSKHAVLLALKERKLLFLVDSDGRDVALYQRLMRRIKTVDGLFLGMECDGAPLTWLYEPLLTKPINRKNNESRRLCGANCERAWNVWQAVKAPRVFIYAMGQEPWMRYIMGLEYTPDSIQLKESDKFISQCIEAGAQAERLFGHRELMF